MKTFITCLILFYCFFLANPFSTLGQEENATAVYQGKKYIDLKIKSIDKYNSRLEQQQDRMLKKLKKKEKKFANKLKNTDSLSYANFKQQPLSYDSISKLSHSDSSTIALKTPQRQNLIIDSIKGVASFIEKKSDKSSPDLAQQENYSTKLNQEKSKLNFRNYITELITKHTHDLKSIPTDGKIPGLTSIDKQAFYGKAKMNVYKEMEEDPTKAEDKAMEYLQGTEGFSASIEKSINGSSNSMQSFIGNEGNSLLAEMGKAGFQTQKQFQTNLEGKLGKSLGGLANNMGSQINEYQKNIKDIKDNLSLAKETKGSVANFRNIDKPSFKVNPMRGLPLCKRIEKQYNWQITKATLNGQPALLEASAMVGFKQTPKLTYGFGVASSVGLGQNWNNIHFSFQGIGYRSYINWEWQYGIGAYVGYERMYNQVVFTNNNKESIPQVSETIHSNSNYSESALIGLTKKYKINSKWNGQVQVLYDVWWQQKGLASPIILRFATINR